MNKGVIWMLHGVEPDSPRTEASELYRNLTVPPARLEELIVRTREAGGEFVSMKRLVRDLSDGQAHRDVLISIDDGFRNIYTDAFPLFRRLNVPFVFFVATDFMEYGFRNCPRAEMDGMMIVLDQARARGADFGKLFRRYRRLRRLLPFADGRKVMRLMFGKGIDYERYRRETVCTPEELREMADSGLCEIGSHTDRHVRLDACRDVERELVESKRKIREWTGRDCEFFSFPYGHSDGRARELVRRHFKAATADVRHAPFAVTETSDRHLLPRVICCRDTPLESLVPEGGRKT